MGAAFSCGDGIPGFDPIYGFPLVDAYLRVGAGMVRFTEKFVVRPDGCWIWTASTCGAGYGQFWLDGRYHRAHRVSYEMFVGPIPEGLVIDHLCRQPLCVNPAHLEPVTRRENTVDRGVSNAAHRNARKTQCDHGHDLTGDNLVMRPGGRAVAFRACRQCELRRYEEAKVRSAPKVRRSPSERLMAKVEILDCGCWRWTASTNTDGSGQFVREGHKRMAAHRATWTFIVGEIPKAHDVMRTCATTLCVNPEHHQLVHR